MEGIRRQFDKERGKWYFSVVDIIALTTSSKNPQNYWKVLKNRFKKGSPELVTLINKCNQLKMKARDGKYYLTDAADVETLTAIIKLIPGARVKDLAACFEPLVDVEKLEVRNEKLETPPLSLPKETPWGKAELLLDAYEDGDYIFIEAFVAGVEPENLQISASENKIMIFGTRPKVTPWGEGEYLRQELLWASFSRSLNLPSPIDAGRIQTSELQGHLIIRLPKI